MSKYITSNAVCKMFDITKQTLNRWEDSTQFGKPFPAPALPSAGGSPKRYLVKEVRDWENYCINKAKKTAT